MVGSCKSSLPGSPTCACCGCARVAWFVVLGVGCAAVLWAWAAGCAPVSWLMCEAVGSAMSMSGVPWLA
eukprot:4001945-Prorocentrum_lima.AAC.1